MLKFSIFQNNVSSYLIKKILFCDVKSQLSQRIPHLKSELYEKLVLLQPNSPPDSKVLKLAVLGCPNSGKSSLVNMLTRWDICAVSGKVNTTRTKQTAILTQDNVQLCFVDMPGILGKIKGLNFKLEKSLIRDPHVGIFESDLIICVIDVSHKASQNELNIELLKALYFFKTKPAILVLNKIDKIGRPMQLFDITRRLTNGTVGGKICHIDSYANRFKKTIPSYYELIADPKMEKIIGKHTSKNILPASNITESLPDCTTPLIDTNIESEVKYPIETSTNHPDLMNDQDKEFLDSLYEPGKTKIAPKFDIDLDDPILDVLKKQLMLTTVSKEEVAHRRNLWREISSKLQDTRETTWSGFEDVFAVSSVTGRGIEQLREYLVNRAKPGPWYFHSSLITDQEPETLVSMCIRANCLNHLEKEIPYQIKIQINNYEKSADGSLHIHSTLRCKTSRQLMTVLGTRGCNIAAIADKSRQTLQKCFQTDVYLKLTAARDGIPAEHMRRMRSVTDTRLLFPRQSSNGSDV